MILSERVRKELGSFLKNMTNRDQGEPLVASQRNGRKFNNVTLSMLFNEIYQTAGIKTSSQSGRRTFATRVIAISVRRLYTVAARRKAAELV